MNGKTTTANRRSFDAQTYGNARQCPDCGSTSREPYRHTTTKKLDTSDHSVWTHLVARRTLCKSCRTPRIDHFYELRIDEQSSTPTCE